MPECVIFVGLPGSGKSSFYRERFAETHALVSKDRMRRGRNIDHRQRQLIREHLSTGRSLVIDNTNVSLETRAPLIALAHELGAAVIGYFFDTPAEDALQRNRTRLGRDRVPDVAIFAMRKRLEAPTRAEGFDALYRVRLDEASGSFRVSPMA